MTEAVRALRVPGEPWSWRWGHEEADGTAAQRGRPRFDRGFVTAL